MYVLKALPLLYSDGALACSLSCRPVLFTMISIQDYLPILAKIGPPRFRRFIVNHLPFKNVKRLRDIVDTIYETSVGIFRAKERALQEGDEVLMKQIGKGKDIISILSMCILMFDRNRFIDFHISLVKENMKASDEDKLCQSEILGQVKPRLLEAKSFCF